MHCSRRSWLAVLALATTLTVTACGDSAGTSKDASESSADAETVKPAATDRGWNEGGSFQVPEPAKDAGKGIKIAYTGFGKDNAFAKYTTQAVEDEARKYGATATHVGPATYDPPAQAQLVIDIATSKSYDAIVIQPIDSASIVPAIKTAVDAGIKVAASTFVIGPDLTATSPQVEGVTTEVVEDIVSNIQSSVDGLAEACEGIDPCEVAMIWGVRALAFDAAKIKPFREGIKQHPNIKVVCEADGNYTQDGGRKVAADCLQAHPNIRAIASNADQSIRGAEKAIKAAGKTYGLGKDDIVLMGSYGTKYAVDAVRKGDWLQTFFARPEAIGRTTVDLLLASLAGKEVPTYVNQADLDGVGDVINKAAFEKYPDLRAQWDG